MKISIIGTGAIGGYYGIMLANAGNEVHFLLRSNYEYVRDNGLYVQSDMHEDIFLPHVNAYHKAEDMPKSDIVLVALKTVQNAGVLPKILPHVADEKSIVVLVQNGLGMEEDVSKAFPNWQIAGGVALITAYKTENGRVVHQDHGNLDLGSYNVRDTDLLDRLVNCLEVAGVPSSRQELDYLRWKKLVWNMSFNGLSVAMDKTTTEILQDENALQRCKTIMAEVIQGAKACGVTLPDDFVEQMVLFTENMRPYSPSMKLDYDFGRPMELEYLYRRPIETARKAGFEMTETAKLYDELHPLDACLCQKS